jgi:hypothetical protein
MKYPLSASATRKVILIFPLIAIALSLTFSSAYAVYQEINTFTIDVSTPTGIIDYQRHITLGESASSWQQGSLSVGQRDVSNIQAYDDSGNKLQVTSQYVSSKWQMTVNFGIMKAAGFGFTFEYTLLHQLDQTQDQQAQGIYRFNWWYTGSNPVTDFVKLPANSTIQSIDVTQNSQYSVVNGTIPTIKITGLPTPAQRFEYTILFKVPSSVTVTTPPISSTPTLSSASTTSGQPASETQQTRVLADNGLLIIIAAVIVTLGLCYLLFLMIRRRKTKESKPQVAVSEGVKKAEPTKKTTMYCNQCGELIPRNSKFCKECGTKITG